ncbi:hypothetical protein CBL_10773 [Carabus blaptoides fortunei]
MTNLRRRASQENTSLNDIFRNEERRFPNAARNIGGYINVKSSMARSRRSGTPPLPATLQEFQHFILDQRHWNVRYGCDLSPATNQFYRTYLQCEDGSEAVLFGSETCLRHVREQGIMIAHMDATFKVVPRTTNIYQLFTIHAVYMNITFPVIYVRMTRKTKQLYESILTNLKDVLLPGEPDFEDADFIIPKPSTKISPTFAEYPGIKKDSENGNDSSTAPGRTNPNGFGNFTKIVRWKYSVTAVFELYKTPMKVQANTVIHLMKQEIKGVGTTPRNVMGNALSEVSNEVLAHMPKKSSLVRTLLNQRKGHLPNPTTFNFEILEKYRQLVLFDSGVNNPDKILALGDEELMLELNKDTIYGDGTFDKKKNVDTYIRMFEILKILIPNLAPQKVLVDFEKACMSAVRIAFPHAVVKGCYFHLNQSVIRKINSVGLKKMFETSVDAKLKLKSLDALSFVPEYDVRKIFDNLAATFPDEENYNDVFTYFFSTYIEGAAGRDPQFPIKIWDHYDAALEQTPKTTNCCEGFHNALDSIFHCSHPSIWFLFGGLQRDLACHRLTLSNAQAGHVEVKKRKYVRLHNLVATAVQEYEHVQNKVKYLRRLANLQ